MDVDSPPTSVQSQISYRQSVLPEVEMFSYLLVIIFLIDQKQTEEVSCLPTLLTPFLCMDELLNPMLTQRKISQVTVFWVKCRGPDVEALMTSTTYSNNVEFKYKDDLTLSFRVGGWSSMCSEISIVYFVVCALKVCVHYQDGDVGFSKIISAFSLL